MLENRGVEQNNVQADEEELGRSKLVEEEVKGQESLEIEEV